MYSQYDLNKIFVKKNYVFFSVAMGMAAILKSQNKKLKQSFSKTLFKIELSSFQYLKAKIYPQVTDSFIWLKKSNFSKNRFFNAKNQKILPFFSIHIFEKLKNIIFQYIFSTFFFVSYLNTSFKNISSQFLHENNVYFGRTTILTFCCYFSRWPPFPWQPKENFKSLKSKTLI